MGEPRRFQKFVLVRHEDPVGVSGTGEVADGVQFADGTVVLRWTSKIAASTAVYGAIEDVETIHGHDGMTEIVWLD